MKQSLSSAILIILVFVFAACQGVGGDLPPLASDAEPATSMVTNPTAKPTPEPDSPETAAETKAVTPVFTPTVELEDESMRERTVDADVEFVKAVQRADGTWTFHVTVRHPDTGWEDYADGWDVVTPDGAVLKINESDPFTRLLLHPHENEQPFTRSQSGIIIPDGVSQVSVRAHDLVDGIGGREVMVDLTLQTGPDFEVERLPE